MRWLSLLSAKWLRRWTLRLGIVAFIVMAVPALTVFAMISIIGIPLALAMLATPPLFVWFAVASLVQRLHGRDGPAAIVASLAVAVLALAGVSAFANAYLDHRADSFLTGDIDTLQRPLRVQSVGLVSLGAPGRSKGIMRCEDLCQRLLLSGAVARVVVADLKFDETEWTAQSPALAYRFEERASCPPIQLLDRQPSRIDDAKPAEAMRLAVAGGRCLIEEPATLAEAEAVITTGRIQRGVNDFGAGLSLLADTVTADRAAVHLREAGSFVQRYRWTGVRVLRHPFVPIPTLVGGAELRMEPGFARNEQRRNVRDFAQDGVDPVRFARDELGLDVSIPSAGPAVLPSDTISQVLDKSGPLQSAQQQVIEDLFTSLLRVREIDEATRLLAFRALSDPRTIAPRHTAALVRSCAKCSESVQAELAAILFRKLMATDPTVPENHPTYLGYPAAYLADAIYSLPPRAVLAHRRELEELSRDPARRRRAHRALVQLSAFGADAVPTLLVLVEDACTLKETTTKPPSSYSDQAEDWQDVYRAGMAGLCRLGSQAAPALPPLMTRLQNGTLPNNSTNRDLVLNTLVQLGADPSELFAALANERASNPRQDFDRRVDRARKKPQCVP